MKKFIGNKQFYMQTILIALPIMAQQFVTTFVNLVDNIMIGSVGGVALTSVTVANRFYLIFNSTIFGACGAGAIYIAQFYGAKQHRKCQEVFSISLVWVILAGVLFTGVLAIAPQSVVHLFSTTPEIVSESVRYIEYAKYTYIPFGISFATIMALRSVGINNIQLKVGVITVVINTILNYCLIFGHFGLPKMGVQGAAIATVIARLVELCIYCVIMIRNRHYFTFDFKGMIHLNIDLFKKMFGKAVPLTINEILFSLGMAMIFKSYMRCDEYLVAAIAVVDTVVNILFTVFSGLSSAVMIMIGNKLGADELEEAISNAQKLLAFGAFVAIIMGSISFFVAQYVPLLYNLENDISQTIIILLRIKSCMLVFYVINVCIFFILRAGGDIRSTLLMDSGFLWFGGVLLSTVLSMYTKLPLVQLYVIVECLDIIKLFVSYHFFKKQKWVKNITVM